MSDGGLTEAIVGKRRRPAIATPDDHAVAEAGPPVARRTVDVEALLPALHDRFVNLKWKQERVVSIDLSGIEQLIVAQLSTCDGIRHERTRRLLIAEEGRFSERQILRLVVHVLAACRAHHKPHHNYPKRQTASYERLHHRGHGGHGVHKGRDRKNAPCPLCPPW